MKTYTEIKLNCMDIFYSCIDRDVVSERFIDYETSFEQVFVYDYPKKEHIEKIIWCFTLVIRFSRCGMLLKENGKLYEETLKNINYIKSLPTQKAHELPSELFDDLKEVESYLKWLKK